MKHAYLFLFAVALAAPLLAQDPDWHSVPKDDLLGNRGEIAKTLLTTTDEAKMLSIVQRPENDEAILYLKMLACKRLGTHGTKLAIPALVAQLDKEKEGFYARYALETIPGPEVDAALCDAAKKLTRAEAIAGVLTTLGVRKNSASAATAKEFLKHENFDIAQAAGYAYAATGGEEAIDFFTQKNLDPKFADSGFLLADGFLKAGKKDQALKLFDALAVADIKPYQKESALYWGIKARGLDGVEKLVEQLNSENPKFFAVGLKAARELPAGAAVTKAMIEQLDKQKDAARKSLLVRAIGDRLDKESKALSLSVVAGFAKSGDEVVRVAAIDSLRNIGDPSVLPTLIDAANQTESAAVAAAAKGTLSNLPGKEIDAAIVDLLDKGNTAQKITAIGLVEDRRILAAYPLLKKSMQDTDADVRKAALTALGQIAGLDDLPVLFAVLDAAEAPEDVKAIQAVLKSACTRMPKDAASDKISDWMATTKSLTSRMFMFDLLKEVGGPKALEIVKLAAFSDSPELKDKGTEMLGSWRSPEDANAVAEVCMKLAKDATENKYKVRGLRGLIRIPRQFNMSEERRLQLCKSFLDLAERNEDKIIVFEVYAKYPTLKTLDLTMQQLGSDAFREKACETAVLIAEKLQGKSPAIVDAMKKVIDTTANDALKAKAKNVLDRQ